MENLDQQKTILCVDDSRLIRSQVASLLSKYGYEVLQAEDGEKALAIMEKTVVDMVLVDLVMPVMDGPALVCRIRSKERWKSVPLLILTSETNMKMVLECLQAGCDDYLLKPVDPRLLYQRVQTLLEKNPRTFLRVKVEVPVDVSTGKEMGVGYLKEIAEGGMSFLFPRELPEGDIVRVNFTLPRQKEHVLAGGEVVYTRADGAEFLNGVRFIILDREAKGRISDFIRTSMEQDS